ARRQVCEEGEDYLRECPQLDVRYHSACIKVSTPWLVYVDGDRSVPGSDASCTLPWQKLRVSLCFSKTCKKKLASGSRSSSGVCNGDDRRRPREDPPPARPDRNEERGPDPEAPRRPHAALLDRD